MGPNVREVVRERIIVKAKTATIIEKEQKAVESEILATFLPGIPKITRRWQPKWKAKQIFMKSNC